jgi:hypothetical protein
MEDDEVKDPEIRGYNRKHKLICGSYELKYPPRRERCAGECGVIHYRIEVKGREEVRAHPCFLAFGHKGNCQFSSECDARYASSVTIVSDVAA